MKYVIGTHIQSVKNIDDLIKSFDNRAHVAMSGFLYEDELKNFTSRLDISTVFAIKQAIIDSIGSRNYFEKCNFKDIAITKDVMGDWHVNISEELHAHFYVTDIDFSVSYNENKDKVSVFVIVELLKSTKKNISIFEKGYLS